MIRDIVLFVIGLLLCWFLPLVAGVVSHFFLTCFIGNGIWATVISGAVFGIGMMVGTNYIPDELL